jgi:hypothetical protein
LIVVTVTVFFLIPHEKPADNMSPEYNNSGFFIPCDNFIPVTLGSFGYTEETITNKVNGSGTVFAARYSYISKAGTKRLDYRLYSSGLNFLVDMYAEETAAGETLTEIDPDPWGANKAYTTIDGKYIIIYDGLVLVCTELPDGFDDAPVVFRKALSTS